ncbi:hypothetical protein GGR57DRAFT_517757 [Xylariaceae sp. FL1272]|nr:hypothetical protein GGR57DRAFT_517757 [Xylariaceae sp. FL1272]
MYVQEIYSARQVAYLYVNGQPSREAMLNLLGRNNKTNSAILTSEAESSDWMYAFSINHVNCDGKLTSWGLSTSTNAGHPENTPNCSSTRPQHGGLLSYPLKSADGKDLAPTCDGSCSTQEPGIEAWVDETIAPQVRLVLEQMYKRHITRKPELETVGLRIIWDELDGEKVAHSSSVTPGHLALMRQRKKLDYIQVDFTTVPLVYDDEEQNLKPSPPVPSTQESLQDLIRLVQGMFQQ